MRQVPGYNLYRPATVQVICEARPFSLIQASSCHNLTVFFFFDLYYGDAIMQRSILQFSCALGSNRKAYWVSNIIFGGAGRATGRTTHMAEAGLNRWRIVVFILSCRRSFPWLDCLPVGIMTRESHNLAP